MPASTQVRLLDVSRVPALDRALDADAAIERVAASKSFDGMDPREIIDIVHKYDALDQAREIARDYAQRARTSLDGFPASPSKETLDLALDFVLERDR